MHTFCKASDPPSSHRGKPRGDEEEVTMTETIDTISADRALKARHRAMWALGDYPAVADLPPPRPG